MGAWIEITARAKLQETCTVAPLVGAWIEILYPSMMHSVSGKSLPSWERGLKLLLLLLFVHAITVAPLVGAWIEIDRSLYFAFHVVSLPSWERGLKYCLSDYLRPLRIGRSPRGSVD